MPPPYLLDTTVLLHWVRDSRQARIIDQQFHLSVSAFRPLICEVSLGEMRAFARSLEWGAKKLARLQELVRDVTAIDISDDRVLDAYAELSTLAKASGWSIFHGKNDLWVAAAGCASGSHVLTTDKDFLPLRGREDHQVTVLDEKTALPLP